VRDNEDDDYLLYIARTVFYFFPFLLGFVVAALALGGTAAPPAATRAALGPPASASRVAADGTLVNMTPLAPTKQPPLPADTMAATRASRAGLCFTSSATRACSVLPGRAGA
jgi:hypothetical protein